MVAFQASQIRYLAFAILASVGLSSASCLAQDGPPTVTVESCTTCHGPFGRSLGDMPTIAGMDEAEMAKALIDFRAGLRTGTIMGRLAGAFTDADISAITQYFSQIEEAG